MNLFCVLPWSIIKILDITELNGINLFTRITNLLGKCTFTDKIKDVIGLFKFFFYFRLIALKPNFTPK